MLWIHVIRVRTSASSLSVLHRGSAAPRGGRGGRRPHSWSTSTNREPPLWIQTVCSQFSGVRGHIWGRCLTIGQGAGPAQRRETGHHRWTGPAFQASPLLTLVQPSIVSQSMVGGLGRLSRPARHLPGPARRGGLAHYLWAGPPGWASPPPTWISPARWVSPQGWASPVWQASPPLTWASPCAGLAQFEVG